MKIRWFASLTIAGTFCGLTAHPVRSEIEHKLPQTNAIASKTWQYLVGEAQISPIDPKITLLPIDKSNYSKSIAKDRHLFEEKFQFSNTQMQWLTQTSDTELVQITGVRLRSTTNGLEVFLETPTAKLLASKTSSQENRLIADIPNAVLNLQQGKEFRAENPAKGITLITVTQQNDNTIRVSVSGTNGVPIANINPQKEGLRMSLSPADAEEMELVVTAQKTPEKPQDVPISLTVLSQKELEDAQVNSFRDIAANTPNFFTTVGDRTFNFYSIRGLSNSNFLVRDTVSFYIDDVPYENAHQFLPGELFDLERVEVLRGPQSTLYGRNSQAGVVNVISRPPTNSPEFRFGAGYGDFNERQAQLSVSDAIIRDRLRFRIAGAYNARDGFTKDTLLDEGANDQSAITGRANLLWTPTKEWSISFNATGSANQDGDNTFVPINQRDRFKVDRNIPGNTDLSVNTQALRIKYEGTAFNFTAITARNSTNLSYQSDGDYTSEDFLRLNVEQDSQIWSQEIRLQSPANADRFRWIIGGYFQSRDFDLDPQSTEYTAAGATAFNLPASGTEGTIARYDQTTLAGFGQIDFKPIKPLTLTAGLRYENSREELDRVFFISSDGREVPTGEALNDSTTEDDILLPKFAVEYRFTPNLSAYGSVTRGYKPPTQNYQTRDLALLEVKPEKSWNYEIGLKSSWLDNRLSANLAFFWNDISDYQVALAGDAGFFEDITNAEVGINGVELELKATPIDGLDVIAGFGYADAKFTQYTNPFTGQNFKDNRLLYAPEFTYNLALQYRSRGGILGRVELQGLGSYFFDDANALKQDSFALVNTRLGYEQKSYSIYFYVNNLFDERYFTSAFVSPAVADPLVSYGDRRTFGVQFKTNF